MRCAHSVRSAGNLPELLGLGTTVPSVRLHLTTHNQSGPRGQLSCFCKSPIMTTLQPSNVSDMWHSRCRPPREHVQRGVPIGDLIVRFGRTGHANPDTLRSASPLAVTISRSSSQQPNCGGWCWPLGCAQRFPHGPHILRRRSQHPMLLSDPTGSFPKGRHRPDPDRFVCGVGH